MKPPTLNESRLPRPLSDFSLESFIALLSLEGLEESAFDRVQNDVNILFVDHGQVDDWVTMYVVGLLSPSDHRGTKHLENRVDDLF